MGSSSEDESRLGATRKGTYISAGGAGEKKDMLSLSLSLSLPPPGPPASPPRPRNPPLWDMEDPASILEKPLPLESPLTTVSRSECQQRTQ